MAKLSQKLVARFPVLSSTKFVVWVTGLVQYLVWVNLSREFVADFILDDKMTVRKRDTHDNFTATPVLLEKVVDKVVL